MQEKDQLRKQLDELTGKIRGIVKDFPAVAYRLGFLQNFTHTQPPTVDISEPAKTQDSEELRGGGEDAVVDQDVRLVGGVLDHERAEGRERGEGNGEEYIEEDQLEDILTEVCC